MKNISRPGNIFLNLTINQSGVDEFVQLTQHPKDLDKFFSDQKVFAFLEALVRTPNGEQLITNIPGIHSLIKDEMSAWNMANLLSNLSLPAQATILAKPNVARTLIHNGVDVFSIMKEMSQSLQAEVLCADTVTAGISSHFKNRFVMPDWDHNCLLEMIDAMPIDLKIKLWSTKAFVQGICITPEQFISRVKKLPEELRGTVLSTPGIITKLIEEYNSWGQYNADVIFKRGKAAVNLIATVPQSDQANIFSDYDAMRSLNRFGPTEKIISLVSTMPHELQLKVLSADSAYLLKDCPEELITMVEKMPQDDQIKVLQTNFPNYVFPLYHSLAISQKVAASLMKVIRNLPEEVQIDVLSRGIPVQLAANGQASEVTKMIASLPQKIRAKIFAGEFYRSDDKAGMKELEAEVRLAITTDNITAAPNAQKSLREELKDIRSPVILSLQT